MMIWYRFFIYLFCLGSLYACTPNLPTDFVPAPSGTIKSFQSWDIHGAIAIYSPQQNFSASLAWQQKAKNYVINLWGPLGAYAMQLTGSPVGVSLSNAKGQTVSAASPELLMQQQLGWQLPVTHLYYWIRGFPAPNIPYQRVSSTLKQEGWKIEYLHYMQVNNNLLPQKILLSQHDIQIKIIIHHW